jgi:hypothetical protein
VEELQGRDEELGLADASLAELEIVLALGAGPGVDAGLHGLDLLDDPQVDRAAPDERLELRQHLLADRLVAGSGARLDEGVALPGPAEGLVVELGGPDAVHDGSAAAVGAKVQVDPEDEPVLGDLGETFGHELREPRVVGEVGERLLAGGGAVGQVDVDEVDVRREVELAGSQLPHGDGAEAGPGRAAGQPLGCAMARAQPSVVEGDGGVERGGGQRRELAGDLVDAGPPEIPERDADHLAGGEAPQHPVQTGHVVEFEPPGGPRQGLSHGGLGAGPVGEGGAGGAREEPGVARQRRRGEPGRAGQEHQRLHQVASGRKLGRVEVPFDAGQRQVRVGSQVAERLHLRQTGAEAAAQAGEPLRSVRGQERGRGDAETGDEGVGGQGRPAATSASPSRGRRPGPPASAPARSR